MATISPSAIRLDGGTQPRATLHTDWVQDYAADMVAGATFPPIVVFFDGADHWLADGFHRTNAALAVGLATIEADIRQGTQRDAILYSVGANSDHGHRRTNDDKRRAVLRLLNDPEWAAWSDREISRRCGVTHEVVGRLRPPPPVVAPIVTPEIEPASGVKRQIEPERPAPPAPAPQPRMVQRNGTTYQQNTANIGRRPAPEPPPPPRPVVVEREEEPAAVYTPPPRFDHEAAAVREKAMGAIRTLANQPPPQAVIDAWMKHPGYGEPVETIEAAIAWLNEFIPLYREAEPQRWADRQEKLKHVA